MTTPLTPESLRHIESMHFEFHGGIRPIECDGTDCAFVWEMEAIEAAAIARDREGLVEVVAQALAGQLWRAGERTRDSYRVEARRILATPAGQAIADRIAALEAVVPEDPWLYDDGRGFGLTCYSCIQWKDLGHREGCRWLAVRGGATPA